ncbi:hypothetical protein D9M69_482040 [compost metagenome]
MVVVQAHGFDLVRPFDLYRIAMSMKHDAMGFMSCANGLADRVAELFGKRHLVAGQYGHVQAKLAQGRGGFHGNEAVADDHHPLAGAGAVQNLLRMGFGAQEEHLRQVGAGQRQRVGYAAGGQQRGVVCQ